jgi:hypothetical protein
MWRKAWVRNPRMSGEIFRPSALGLGAIPSGVRIQFVSKRLADPTLNRLNEIIE